MVLIIKLYGRLGNNILQIINACNDNINLYKHKYIDITEIKNKYLFLNKFPDILIFDEFNDDTNIIIDTFFYNTTSKVKDNIICIINKYIIPYLDYNLNNVNNLDIDFDNDLIIHIRSGDIFRNNIDFNFYQQPPYSFYKRIIEDNVFNKIYILSENYNLNPIILKLQENYDNVVFLHNELDLDFKIMLNAKYFVNSNSTLSAVINMLSFKKKIFYSYWSLFYTNNQSIFYNYNDFYLIKNNTFNEKIHNLLNN